MSQNYFKKYNLMKIKKLDDIDIRILLFIYLEVNHCVYLANFLDMTKQAIHLRVVKLEEAGLIERKENSQKWFRISYHLTQIAAKSIDNMLPSSSDFNLIILINKTHKLLDTI